MFNSLPRKLENTTSIWSPGDEKVTFSGWSRASVSEPHPRLVDAENIDARQRALVRNEFIWVIGYLM
jgi:hypothetical protein